MDGKQLGNVIYFDPNKINVSNNAGDNLNLIFNGVELMRDPEDLSIAINLEVTPKSRNNLTLNDQKMTFTMPSNGKASNFLQGKNIGNTNVLTSFFTDITHTGDDNGVNNEAMCINSIEIEFQSWYVASVKIIFSDVRGSSLFSPSEDIFNQTLNSETISEKSIFSSFFSYPYPIFNLKIKGIYGDAVTYPLHMTDFKSEFNSDKGTYDITTSYIGYTYAILNDIQMPYLLAAPYTKDYGETYWNEQVKNGRFKTLEGSQLQRIPDMFQKIKKGEFLVSNLQGSNENAKALSSLASQMNDIVLIKTMIDDYVSVIIKNYTVTTSSNKYFLKNIKIKQNSVIKYIDPILTNDSDAAPFIQKLYSAINSFIKKYTDSTVFKKYENEEVKKYFTLKPTNTKGEYKLDLTEIIGKIDNQIKQYNNKTAELNDKVSSTITNTQSEAYGMVPSIYNFTKMLLAHLETLLYTISKCAKSANDSIDRTINGSDHEIDLKNSAKKCPPFPGFSISNIETWIGTQYPNFDEVSLVKSFIKARTDVSSSIEQYDTSDPSSDVILNGTENSIGEIWLPINAFDNSIEGIGDKTTKPYSNIINNGANSNDIKTVLSNRIATISSLSTVSSFFDNKDLLNSIILGESLNIIEELGKTQEHVTKVITALNSILEDYKTKNDIYTTLTPYKLNSKIERFKYNLLNSGILPMLDETTKDYNKKITNGKVVTKFKYFFDNNKEINTDLKKYPPTSISIVEGKENCDQILNNWLNPLKLKYSDNKNIELMLSRYKNIQKSDSSRSFINENYNKQPLMNKIGFIGNGGIKIEKGKNDIYYSNFLKYCGLDSYIFNNSESTLKNMYKFYLGKDNKQSVENIPIDFLKISDMFLNNESDSEKLTYPMVGGNLEYINGDDIEENVLFLFGHPLYYSQNNHLDNITARKNKAFLFLQTLPIKISSFDKYIIKGKLNKTFMCRMPKIELLLIGSMLWRYKYGDGILKGNVKNITIPDTTYYFRKQNSNVFTFSNDKKENFQKCTIIDYIINSGMNYNDIIKYFEDWVNDNSNNDGWLKIQDSFELHKKDGGFFNDDSFIDLVEKMYKNNSDTTFNKYVHSINIGNYWVKRYAGKNQIGLITKDSSDGVKAILNLIFNESIFSFIGYGIINDGNNKKTDINYNIVEAFVKGLIKAMKDHNKTLTNIKYTTESSASNNIIRSIENSEDIQIQVYKYLKTLYDKWVSGYLYNDPESEYKWINQTPSNIPTSNGSFSTCDLKNFKFLDRSYNNIGYKFIVNYKDICENYINFSEQRTLYSTITDILGKYNFLFVPMPNYQRWEAAVDFAKIFEPIPFSKSKMTEDSKQNPIFLCVYSGEPAKKLNVNSEEYIYVDDSLDLNIEKNTTIPFDFMSNKITENFEDPYKVPAFAVNYGKQNQQYFKNIRLAQTNPVTTEASILATYNLTKRADSNTNVQTTDQSMYNIYSNYAYTCQIDMPGCAQIQPMMYFQLTNIPMWNGAYLIYKINHSITPGNMTTSFTGVKMSKKYPKLTLPLTVGINDFNIGGINIAPKTTNKNTLSLDTKLGPIGYFKLRDYLKEEDSGCPEYIVSRLQNNVAPIIDSLMDTWMASDIQRKNNYGKFTITNGYRNPRTNAKTKGSSENSMHKEGLAVDIQLIGSKNSAQGNNAIFEHIREKMSNGLKIDQVIREDNKIICHIGVAKVDNVSVYVRGQVLTRDPKGADHLIDTINNATTNGTLSSKSPAKVKWFEYWKEAENSKSTISGGWNKEKKLWYAHNSAEGGDPTISYGIKLSNGYLQSIALKSLSLIDLQNKVVGITDKQASDEIMTQADLAYNDISNYIESLYGKNKFDNINEKYRYGLVDIYMNHGGNNFKTNRWAPFINAAIHNDLNGMLNNCTRGNDRRTLLFKQYLRA